MIDILSSLRPAARWVHITLALGLLLAGISNTFGQEPRTADSNGATQAAEAAQTTESEESNGGTAPDESPTSTDSDSTDGTQDNANPSDKLVRL